MQPTGKLLLLFQAFVRINQHAFRTPRLVCCPTLSKAPNYGQVLHRYLTGATAQPLQKRHVLRLALRYCVTNATHYMFLLLARLFIFLLGWKMPTQLTPQSLLTDKKPLLAIDTFALLPQTAREKRYQEMYLPGVWETAHAQGYNPVRLYRFYGSRSPVVLWRSLAVLSQNGPGITDVHLLTLRDWLALAVHIVAYPVALYRLIQSLSAHPHGSPEYAIREALIHSAGQCVLVGEARRLAAFRLGKLLTNVQAGQGNAPKVVTWYENQTLNKTFMQGLRAAQQGHTPQTVVVGAQLFTWPASLLNNHADDTEAALGLAPDVVAVTGPAFLPSHSTQRYAVGPALRYGYLFGNTSTETQQQQTHCAVRKPLLVLLSYHPEETRRVLQLVLPLAAQPGSVVYKFHPTTHPHQYEQWLPHNPQLVTGPLPNAIAGACGVIGAGSGALAEAVCLGCPALAVHDPAGQEALALNYLPDYGRNTLWSLVANPYEVAPTLAALNAFCQTPEYEQQRAAFTALLFTQPTPHAVAEFVHLA